MEPGDQCDLSAVFVEDRAGRALVRLPNGSKTSLEYSAIRSPKAAESIDDLTPTIRALETELLLPAVRRSADRLNELLHDDFIEVGKSGRRWTKQTCIEGLITESDADLPATEIESFTLSALHSDGSLVLAEWTMSGVRRSSIWVLDDGRWRMRYHQGTRSSEVVR